MSARIMDGTAALGLSPSTNFSDVLREGTASVHRETERSGFIADLIRARATLAGYALFLRNLVPAYRALEAALDRHVRTGEVVSAFAGSALRRSAALESDLRAVAGDRWTQTLALLPEATAYAEAIDRAAREPDGHRLCAQAYARYLGDLSGGQILKPVLARTLGLAPNALAFYDFPDLADPNAAKRAMRDALDRIAVGSPEAAAVLDEAGSAFRHNIRVSAAVQAATG